MSNALYATTLPIYPGLGQALNKAGLHNCVVVWSVWFDQFWNINLQLLFTTINEVVKRKKLLFTFYEDVMPTRWWEVLGSYLIEVEDLCHIRPDILCKSHKETSVTFGWIGDVHYADINSAPAQGNCKGYT